MKRMNVFAALALTLGVFACDRSDRASETNTTSATPPPAEPMTTPAPAPPPLDESREESREISAPAAREQTTSDAGPKDGGPKPRRAASDTTPGLSTGTLSGTTGNPNSGTTARPANGGVAPGHIMFPPDKGPGTGEPNSNGSHDLGSGTSAGKR